MEQNVSTYRVNASRMNLFKNKVDTSLEGRLHIDEKLLDSR